MHPVTYRPSLLARSGGSYWCSRRKGSSRRAPLGEAPLDLQAIVQSTPIAKAEVRQKSLDIQQSMSSLAIGVGGPMRLELEPRYYGLRNISEKDGSFEADFGLLVSTLSSADPKTIKSFVSAIFESLWTGAMGTIRR